MDLKWIMEGKNKDKFSQARIFWWVRINLMKITYLKSAWNLIFYVSIAIKIPFFRVSITIEPGRSLLAVRYHDLFDAATTMNRL